LRAIVGNTPRETELSSVSDHPSIVGPKWAQLAPDLQRALCDIADRAAGPFGIRLQRAVDDHLDALTAALSGDAGHRGLARLLHEAGVAARDGAPPTEGAVSRAMNRARSKSKDGADAVAPERRPATERANFKSDGTESGEKLRPQIPDSTIRSAMEPGSARCPIPPPVCRRASISLISEMTEALKVGVVVNELNSRRRRR
jgi:hypothetical protein